MSSLKSWGNYPSVKSKAKWFDVEQKEHNFDKNTIPYGNGRSYGDSCLSDHIIQVKRHNHFLAFDENTGILKVQAGVLLKEVIDVCLPKGWFLKVVPGTKLITVAGAIASDIHGKNHHIDGCFSESVNYFNILLPNGDLKKCSRTDNTQLFHASCGGMGLTGVITEVELSLKKVQSANIQQTTIKSRNLKETFAIFEKIKSESYSVAWIDCLSKGDKLGRSHVIYGDFMQDGDLAQKQKSRINIPFYFPSWTLNKLTIKLFNWFYYHKAFTKNKQAKANYDSFFFPLDAIKNWNRIYGKRGFTQYQFILPLESSFEGISQILTQISDSGKGSFLAVLKLYGQANKNFLSFPMEGYSLALDFKIEKGIFELLDNLDKVVVQHGGRVYLSKDVRVTKEVFEKGYPMLPDFKKLRNKFDLKDTLNSLQSRRLDI